MTQETDKTHKPIIITLELNEVPLDMELDTGGSLTLVNKSTNDKITHDASTGPEHSNAQLWTYTSHLVEILGTTLFKPNMVSICYNYLYMWLTGKDPTFMVEINWECSK